MSQSSELTAPTGLGRRHIEILDALERIFHREGYRGLTVGKLAARLNCSRSTLYDIAPSKRDLFHAVLRRWSQRLRAGAREAAAREDDPIEKLKAVSAFIIYQTSDESQAFLDDVEDDEVAREIIRGHIESQIDLCMGFIREGVRRGQFRKINYRLSAEICINTAMLLREGHFLGECGLSLSEAYEEWLNMFLFGLQKPAGLTRRMRPPV